MILRLIFILTLIYTFLTPAVSHAADMACPDCNIILISIDTMRADRTGSSGYFRKITPNLDSFSKDAVIFKTHIAQAPSTAPSHASIFTSLIPASHGAFIKRKTEIRKNVSTITELLKSKGYRTASFNGGGQLDKKFGFARGFDIYDSYSDPDYVKDKMSDKVSSGINWIKADVNSKFFLFLHTYDIHVPYAPLKEDIEKLYPGYKGKITLPVASKTLKSVNSKKITLSEDDKKYIEAAYDAEILSVDRDLKALFDYLKKANLYSNTVIVITSDHGEEFGEHGYMGWHSHTLYDELIRIPLIIKLPNQVHHGKIIAQQTRSIDIAPSILEILKIGQDKNFQGKSLLDLIEKGESYKFEEYAISQKDREDKLPTSVRSKDWKLYNKLLFNLNTDPKELKSITAENPEIAGKFNKEMTEARKLDVPSEAESVQIENESFEQLKTLGYL